MKKCIIYFLFFISFSAYAQERILLYNKIVPNAKPVENQEEEHANDTVDSLTYAVSTPSLTVYLPAKNVSNGTAVIICPGGGYHVLLSKREGSDVAKAFNKLGVTAFVLRYRLPDDDIMLDKTIGPLQDAQQAIKYVRENAEKWGIDLDKIGIMGFSAGGHLASTAGVHFDSPQIPNDSRTNLRPDFMLLINPVISFTDEIGHTGSRENLLGKHPNDKAKLFFSSELQVKPSTPPAFLVHADPDELVPV
jgi:acetyl esterase/lipase